MEGSVLASEGKDLALVEGFPHEEGIVVEEKLAKGWVELSKGCEGGDGVGRADWRVEYLEAGEDALVGKESS